MLSKWVLLISIALCLLSPWLQHWCIIWPFTPPISSFSTFLIYRPEHWAVRYSFSLHCNSNWNVPLTGAESRELGDSFPSEARGRKSGHQEHGSRENVHLSAPPVLLFWFLATMMWTVLHCIPAMMHCATISQSWGPSFLNCKPKQIRSPWDSIVSDSEFE